MKRIISFASLLTAAAMLISCEELNSGSGNEGTEGTGNQGGTENTASELVLKCSKDVIKSDGNDASVFTLTLGDEEVTEGVTFFDGDMNEVEIKDFRFTSDKDGIFTFWAAYKTYNSEQITIRAINADIPETAADSDASNTSFVRRVFISQFTGTGCGYCPAMTYIMKEAVKKYELQDKYILSAVHCYGSNDPAYLAAPNYGNFGGQGAPWVVLDMSVGYGYGKNEISEQVDNFGQAMNAMYNEQEAKVGISANPVFADALLANPDIEGAYDDYLIVKVAVKAAEDGEYSLGTWLMEDDLYGEQSDYENIKKFDKDHDYDTHNNCVRVADSKNGSLWTGHPIGTVKKGEVVEKTFLMKVKSSWKRENMHMAIFVTEKTANGGYKVNNVVDCKVNKPTPFEYRQ